MNIRALKPKESSAVERLFTSVFTASEGDAEGALIGNLARELMAQTDRRDLFGFVAVDREHIVGAIFFSRLTVAAEIDLFLLAPVAVHEEYQGMGVGQALITHGLEKLTEKGVDIVVTYGDPAFYSKVGFQSLSTETIPPPFDLSQPDGWLGQSLTEAPLAPLPGPCSCVAAFDDPAYW